jgi:glyoxylase I family protein
MVTRLLAYRAANDADRGAVMTENATAPAVTGVHHFSPTVSDVEASAEWYERVFGMSRVPITFPHHGAEEDGYAVLLMDPRSGSTIRA